MPFAKRSAFRRPARKKTRPPPFALSFSGPGTGNAPARRAPFRDGARRARHTGAEGRNRPLHPPVRDSRSPGPGRPIRPRDERRSPARHDETGRRPQQNRLRKGPCAAYPRRYSPRKPRLQQTSSATNRTRKPLRPRPDTDTTKRDGRATFPPCGPVQSRPRVCRNRNNGRPSGTAPRPGHGDSSRNPLSLPGPEP